MRHFIAVAFIAALTACGSSTPTDGTPPPPPASTPASVAVMAGDGQQAEPGTPVALTPSVIVKDAAGAPLSGVTVTFSADSGGGAVTGGSAVTGGNGVATVGSWTLGSTEGRNILKATVGTLAAVRIAATAIAAATATFPAMSIGAGGGSIAINQAGPLHGFALALPGGAFAAATEWTVSYSSNTAVPRTAGVNPITPLLTIASTTGIYAKSTMTLTLPATVPAGMVPFIVLRDPVSGTMEVLATTVISRTLVQASTAHLNGTNLIDTLAGAGSLRHAALRNGYNIEVFVTGLTEQQLALDVDTHFRPGTDDWEFESLGTVQSPDGICAGISITAIWYYFFERNSVGKLWNRYTKADNVPASDVTGIQWASLVQFRLDQNDFAALNQFIQQSRGPGHAIDLTMYNTLKANLLVTGQPQLMALDGAVQGGLPLAGHAAIAWKTVGHQIFIDDASFPGNQTTQVTFDGRDFVPFTTPDHIGGAARNYTEFYTIGLSQMMPLDQLRDDWPSVVDGTINRDAFPRHSWQSTYGELSDTLWLSDTITVWTECSACHPVLASPSLPDANPSLNALHPWRQASTWISGLPNPVAYVLGFPLDVTSKAATSPGLAYQYAAEVDGTDGLDDDGVDPAFIWLGWRRLSIVKLGVQFTPVAPTPFVNTPFDFSVTLTGTLPAHMLYEWDFGDQTGKVLRNDDGSVQHTFARAGAFIVTLKLRDPANQQLRATATVVATVSAPFIDLTVSGNWANNTAPALGTYHFADFNGGRALNPAPGLDALLGTYDRGSIQADGGASSGILISLVIPAGSALHAGQTFTKWVSGPPTIGAGQFNFSTMVHLDDPDNSLQVAPGTGGTFTVTAITIAADGTGFFSYTFSMTNGAGGTISGSGVSPYK